MRAQRRNEQIAQDHFRRYLRLQAKYDRQIKAALQVAAREAYRLILTLPTDTFAQSVRITQYNIRALAIRQIMESLWGRLGRITINGIRQASTIGASQAEMVTAALGRNLGDEAQALFAGMREAAVQSIRNIQSRFINSINLSPRVYGNTNLASGRVDSIVNNGILLGKSAREIAKDVRSLILPNTPGGVSYAAFRLARTELNNAFHTTQSRSYAEMPWVVGVQWHLSRSHPRRDECNDYADQDHDGLGRGVFSPQNVPGKPHPQCLCYVTPATEKREDFLDNLVAGRYDNYVNRQG